MKVVSVVGTRPNVVKIFPLLRAFARHEEIVSTLVDTGQHYDHALTDVFFQDLELPAVDYGLGVGSGTHAQQTAATMTAFGAVLLKEAADVVVVVGDVNSTLACGLVAAQRGVPLAHVEAGLRSYDRSMPEETNRVVTDTLADYLFAPSRDACDNLVREGVPPEKISFVGNVMVDTLLQWRDVAAGRRTRGRFGLGRGEYALFTLHRPENVDARDRLGRVLEVVNAVCREIPGIFPVHPRTLRRIAEHGLEALLGSVAGLTVTEPMGYLDFLSLMTDARCVITDSGGIQEETTVLGIPCLTVRERTERPVTVSEGTNTVVGLDPGVAAEETRKILRGDGKRGRVPELWDGGAAERVAELLIGQVPRAVL
jgi:UDP-N-acetylglucosamine 2-epimerase (non-hydrolysing)